jgi:hypothetical protein
MYAIVSELLDKTQYFHGTTKRYGYKSALTAMSASRVVSPAEYFILPGMFDVIVIQKYSSAMVLHPKPHNLFCRLTTLVWICQRKRAYSGSSKVAEC